MKKRNYFLKSGAVFLALLLVVTPGSFAQETSQGNTGETVIKQEDLDQLLAPIALYPDSLVSQILMASTYPLEIVQADRWAKENKALTGDALTKALEAQSWDPSVKSLVNFPQVLDMMNSKLEQTQKLGDAFLAQQKAVLDTIQNLRKKAEAAGNLKTTPEQKVIVEKETIIIEAADPKVVYVPVYNPTVVYGVWWWPHHPPYYYYPPNYAYTSAAFSFATGVAVGAAWGYAWGNCNWHGGDVNINVNQNTNINANINRSNYAAQYNKSGQAGTGSWQHDASHRKGVSYNDQKTAQKYNKASTNQMAKSRESYRGHAEQGRQNLAKNQGAQRSQSPSTSNLKSGSSGGNSAFSGIDKGSSTRQQSSRGKESLSSSSRSKSGSKSGSRSGGGGGRR